MEGVSYKLSGQILHTHNGKKYLSIPKDSFDFEVIDDVGATEEKGVEEEEKMKGVVVIAILMHIMHGIHAKAKSCCLAVLVSVAGVE